MERDKVEFTLAELDEIKQWIADSEPETPLEPKLDSLRAIVYYLSKELLEKRKAGWSYESLANLLAKRKIIIQPSTLERYLIEAQRKRSKKSKSSNRPKSTSSKSTKKGNGRAIAPQVTSQNELSLNGAGKFHSTPMEPELQTSFNADYSPEHTEDGF